MCVIPLTCLRVLGEQAVRAVSAHHPPEAHSWCKGRGSGVDCKAEKWASSLGKHDREQRGSDDGTPLGLLPPLAVDILLPGDRVTLY